ncbi:MAG: hypothetical protein AAGE65_13660 [Planctomycetota bacterium]
MSEHVQHNSDGTKTHRIEDIRVNFDGGHVHVASLEVTGDTATCERVLKEFCKRLYHDAEAVT